MKKDIVHIHVPKTGGTWLNKTLEKYAPEAFLRTGLGDGNRCSIDDALQYRGKWNLPSPLWYDNVKPELVTHGWRTFLQSADLSGKPYRWWTHGAHKVSICRNPFDYIVSQFHWDDAVNPHLKKLRRYMPEGVALGAGLSNLRHGIRSFDEYIEKFCDPEFPWHGTNTIEDEQRYFLFHQMFNHDGTCGMNQIIRNEKLSAGSAIMLRDLGYIDDGAVADIANSERLNVSAMRKKKDYRSYYTDAQREMIERKCKAELLLYGYDFDGPTDDSPFVDPKSLFYHPVIPFAGKFLSCEMMREFDTKIRGWLGVEEEGGVVNFGSVQINYIRGAQSPYPDVWVRALGVKINDITPSNGNAHVVVLGHPLTPKPAEKDWWEPEQASTSPGFTLVGDPYYYQKSSFREVLTSPSHVYAGHTTQDNWNARDLIKREARGAEKQQPVRWCMGNAMFWQGMDVEELVPIITNKLLELEKK